MWEGWRHEYREPDDPPPPLVCIYECLSCGRPTAVEFKEGGDDSEELTPKTWAPVPRPPRLDVPEYNGTEVFRYRFEAWAAFEARRYRSALVMARSALQACSRRYLPRSDWSKGGFGGEMERLGELAGRGWRAVAIGVKDFGDEWAHPDPARQRGPTQEDVQEALRRMDAILRFTAELERVGHLPPRNEPQPAEP